MSDDRGRRSRRRFTQLAVVSLAMLVAIGAVVAATHREHAAAARAGAGSAAGDQQVGGLASRPTLLVVGDSFAGGTGNPDFDVYPDDLASAMGWNVRVDAQGGTGFVNSGQTITAATTPSTSATAKPPTQQTFPLIDRLDGDRKRYSVDYVLVDAGRNDLGIDPAQVAAAITTYFDRLQSLFPTARKAIVIPSYVTLDPADNYPYIRDALLSTAAKIHADVMDPVAEGWYRGVDLPSMLGPDGIHFNGPGNEFYARKIGDRLRQFGYPEGEGGAG